MRALLALLITATAACTAPAGGPAQADPFAGHYEASGGGGALAQMQSLTAAFSAAHPSVKWALHNVGSDGAVPLVAAKQIDLGFISRDPTAAERDQVDSLSLGITGTGLAVRATNPVANLTLPQVRAIYTGDVTDWATLGGTPGAIHTFNRDASAPTRLNFEEVVFGMQTPAYPKDMVVASTGNEMADELSAITGAIGVVTIKDIRLGDPRIKVLALNGIAATKENVDNGTFPMRRPLFLVYPHERGVMKPAIAAFIDFVRSAEGQRIIAGF